MAFYSTADALRQLTSSAATRGSASNSLNSVLAQSSKDLQKGFSDFFNAAQKIVEEENAKKDFVKGLKELGAKESIINAVKDANSSDMMRNLAALGMTEPKHTGYSANGGEFRNPLTGEIRGYDPLPQDPLDAELKRAKINSLNQRPSKEKEYKPNLVDVYNLGDRGLGLLNDNDKQALINAGLGEFRMQGDKKTFLIDAKKIPEINAWLEKRYQSNLMEREKELLEKKNKAPNKQKQEPLYKVEEKDGRKILQRQFLPLFQQPQKFPSPNEAYKMIYGQ